MYKKIAFIFLVVSTSLYGMESVVALFEKSDNGQANIVKAIINQDVNQLSSLIKQLSQSKPEHLDPLKILAVNFVILNKNIPFDEFCSLITLLKSMMSYDTWLKEKIEDALVEALIVAIGRNNTQRAVFLIEKSVKVRNDHPLVASAVINVVSKNNIELMKLLIKEGVSIYPIWVKIQNQDGGYYSLPYWAFCILDLKEMGWLLHYAEQAEMQIKYD
jgi:hypothetical protein